MFWVTEGGGGVWDWLFAVRDRFFFVVGRLGTERPSQAGQVVTTVKHVYGSLQLCMRIGRHKLLSEDSQTLMWMGSKKVSGSNKAEALREHFEKLLKASPPLSACTVV